jgi:FKBP-type peptidyl-prolyl cis-trans isomerase
MWLQEVGKKGWLVMAMVGAIVILQSCTKEDAQDVYDYNGTVDSDFVTLHEYMLDNGIDADVDSANKIFSKKHISGDGYKTVAGAKVLVHYQGVTLDGVEFASTIDSDPAEFTLGDVDSYLPDMTGAVSFGIFNMRVGDSVSYYIPSSYGFQNTTFQNVPPNSILVYHIKFVEIKKLDEELEQIDVYIDEKNMSPSIDPDYGTRYVIHRQGNLITPELGALISLNYQGELLNGNIFDASPMQFTYGDGKRIKGFDLGISNLHENDSATIFIPSIYGYGENAQGEDIPANSVILFNLDITRISNL